MTEHDTSALPPTAARHHIALHLAHRWFAYLEAPGGDLEMHLAIFSPQVRLSGHRGSHLFARDHESLVTWFASIPDAVSSHHIVHSNYSTIEGGDGLLNMVVAYQSPAGQGMHGSIISYETRIEFMPDGARFIALDKTPILVNTRLDYETSWSTNRVLARVHAELGGIGKSDGRLCAALGGDVRQVHVQAVAPEGSRAYHAVVTGLRGESGAIRTVHLDLTDDVKVPMPKIERIVIFDPNESPC
jgi:hypothetical protein